MYVLTTPLRLLINIVQWIRRFFYQSGILKSYELPGYVVSVGNIEFGGTGKTPLVIYLVESLIAKGFQPVVLTRGYRSSLKKNEFSIMLDGKVVSGTKIENCDEPMLISKKQPKTPVIIGQNRKDAASFFLEFSKTYKPTHWILDDGFQHLKIRRDFNICLMTGKFLDSRYWFRSFSREFLFAKKHADLVLLTKSASTHTKMDRCDFSIESVYHSDSGELLDMNKEVSLFAGIAKPDYLLQQLNEFGLRILHKLIVQDHTSITKESFEGLANHGFPVVMTEKDYFRQEHYFLKSGVDIFLVRQKVHVDQTLFDKIYNSIKG